MTRLCRKCNIEKPVDQFYTTNIYWCKKCKIKERDKWRKNNPEALKQQRDQYFKSKAYSDKYNALENRFKVWQKSARIRKIEWNITIEDVKKIPMKCLYTGIDLTLESKKPNTISLDRIDSTKAYTPDNIALCCWRINKMKSTFSIYDFFYLCKEVTMHQSSKD